MKHKDDSTGPLPQLSSLMSVQQLVSEYPHLFTEGSLRWTIFNRKQNGFDSCVVRLGRRILIDTVQLQRWIAKSRGRDHLQNPPRPPPSRQRPRKSRR